METHLGQSATVWNPELGCFISSSHQRVAELINEYNPYFSLVFIPPANRDATDTKPYAILDSSPARPPYVMRYLSLAEMENPAEIIEWIFNGDQSKHRPVDIFQKMLNREAAEKLLELKKREEEYADAHEFAEFAFGSRSKNTWKHNGQTYRK
jgi:hypothetical protein